MGERLEYLQGTQGLLEDLTEFCDRADVLDLVAEGGGLRGHVLRSVLMDLGQWLYSLEPEVAQAEKDHENAIAAITETEKSLNKWLLRQAALPDWKPLVPGHEPRDAVER